MQIRNEVEKINELKIEMKDHLTENLHKISIKVSIENWNGNPMEIGIKWTTNELKIAMKWEIKSYEN